MEIEDHTPHTSVPILASRPLSRSKKLWYVLIASIIGSIAVIIINYQSELLLSSIIGIFLGQAIGYFAIAGLAAMLFRGWNGLIIGVLIVFLMIFFAEYGNIDNNKKNRINDAINIHQKLLIH